MEPHTLLLEESLPEQTGLEPDYGIAPGGCFPAPSHLPMMPSHPDWVLDLISDHLPWGWPMPGGPMPSEPMPVEPYGTPV
jgi:hypothetical protein